MKMNKQKKDSSDHLHASRYKCFHHQGQQQYGSNKEFLSPDTDRSGSQMLEAAKKSSDHKFENDKMVVVDKFLI